MSEKQKPETAETPAPAEVNDETLDQINGGLLQEFQFDGSGNTKPTVIKIYRD